MRNIEDHQKLPTIFQASLTNLLRFCEKKYSSMARIKMVIQFFHVGWCNFLSYKKNFANTHVYRFLSKVLRLQFALCGKHSFHGQYVHCGIFYSALFSPVPSIRGKAQVIFWQPNKICYLVKRLLVGKQKTWNVCFPLPYTYLWHTSQ